eukprot:EG_transcript_32738
MEGWGSGGPPERNLRKGIRRGRRKDLEDPATPAAEPYIEGKVWKPLCAMNTPPPLVNVCWARGVRAVQESLVRGLLQRVNSVVLDQKPAVKGVAPHMLAAYLALLNAHSCSGQHGDARPKRAVASGV